MKDAQIESINGLTLLFHSCSQFEKLSKFLLKLSSREPLSLNDESSFFKLGNCFKKKHIQANVDTLSFYTYQKMIGQIVGTFKQKTIKIVFNQF